MLQAKVVLANGSLVTTSETSHPDVFWTLRGGGGSVVEDEDLDLPRQLCQHGAQQ